MKKTHSAERLMPPVVSRAGVACLVVFIVVPVLYLVALALSPNSTVALGGTDFRHFTGANFTGMWSAAAVARGMLNSVIIAGISAALAVILGVCAAYPLARLSFRARKPLLYSLLGSQSIPQLALLRNLPLALKFIQVSTSPAAQLEQFKIMGWMPVTQPGVSAVEQAYPDTVPFISAEENSTPTDYTPAWSYIETGVLAVIGHIAQQLATGQHYSDSYAMSQLQAENSVVQSHLSSGA